jgi:hypothetical protein
MASPQNSKLRQALERHAAISEKKLRRRHPHAASWFAKRGIAAGDIRAHAARLASVGALTGMLLGTPLLPKGSSFGAEKLANAPLQTIHQLFADQLKTLLPDSVHPLNPEIEDLISQMIKEFWGIKAAAILDGERLNTSYGYMGAEQHLPRFPGDSVTQHEGIRYHSGQGCVGVFCRFQKYVDGRSDTKRKVLRCRTDAVLA